MILSCKKHVKLNFYLLQSPQPLIVVIDVKKWMSSIIPKLNDDKTELILIIGSNIKKLTETAINIIGMIATSAHVDNLGATIDHDMSMLSHSKSLYFQIKKISSIQDYLNKRVIKALVSLCICLFGWFLNVLVNY